MLGHGGYSVLIAKDDPRIVSFLKEAKTFEERFVRQLNGEIGCDFCNDHGYIEIVQELGPKVNCPVCNKDG